MVGKLDAVLEGAGGLALRIRVCDAEVRVLLAQGEQPRGRSAGALLPAPECCEHRRALNLPSGLVVNVETDPSVTAADLEDALQSETSVPGFLIERTEIAGRAQFSISIHLPASAIVEHGRQKLDAVTTLRAVADALAKVNIGR